MKRKSIDKKVVSRQRRNRSHQLKAAALTLGLATAWGGGEAEAGFISSTATATITIEDASAFALGGGGASSTATVTIGLADALGQIGGGSSLDDVLFDLRPDDGYFFVGVSGGELVLSFPNNGNGVVGEFWGSLFAGAPTERDILDQLETSSFQTGQQLDPKSPLGLLVEQYGDTLRTPYGQESTYVAFSASPNNGVFGGTLRQSVVPEPSSIMLVLSAAGAILGVRRFV